MRHRRTLLAALTLALGVSACGGSPDVVLQAEPVGVPDVAATEEPAPEEPDAAEPEVLEVEEPEEEPAPAPEPVEPTAEPTRSPSPAPAPAPAPSPSSSPSEPVLVVDEDGCVTDVELGIVITCHDPAAGPD